MRLFLIFIFLLGACCANAQEADTRHGLKSFDEIESDTMHHGFTYDCRMNKESDVIFKIFKDGTLFQQFNVGYVYLGEGPDGNEYVHIVDVNFDGYADYIAGMDFPRYGMAVVIYNPESEKFEWSDDYLLQSPMFDVENKAIYNLSADGPIQMIIRKFVPFGTGIKNVGMLRITADVEMFNEHADPEFQVKHKYDFLDPDEISLAGYDTFDKLPEAWRNILEAMQMADY